MKRPLLICLLSSASLAAVATAALADPPARVGRVAYTEGDISFQPPQSEEWTLATRNFPVAPGEAFWTGDDGRAELQIGSVDTRLDSQTELDVVDVDYGDMRLALPQGSADLRLWSNPRRPVIIATPAGDVRLDTRGLYRIDVGAPAQDGAYPPVEVTVFEGAAEAPSPEGMAPVQAGQAALVYAGYDPQFQYAENAAIDDWGRDLETRTGWRPNDDTSAALTGYGDLYAAGDFSTDPQYGQVWFPRDVPDDWAPYRYGHWAYVEPWGYTWIDDQPWGFAPFHYGRWAQIGGRWGWVPGRPTPEPVYAPALVAFFGGAGWRLGDSDAIGWAPLAPDEDYRPGYSVSDDYRRRLNEGSVRDAYRDRGGGGERAAESYRNARAATVVRAADFSGARPVRAAALPVAPNVIATAPVAPPQAHPAPTPWARSGLALRQGAGGPSAPTPPAVARPPSSLAVVRRAVVAPPPAPGRPPVIAGARITPPAPPAPPGAGRPTAVMVAPAQLRHPQGQGGQPMPQPRPVYTGGSAGAPARSGASDASQRAAEAQAAAQAQADQARHAQMQQERDAAARAQADQARQAQAQAARAQADQARQAQMQQARDAAARTQAEEARQAQAQAAARAQAEQAQARAAQAQAQAQAQAARAQADQARQAQMQVEQAHEAQARAQADQARQAQARQAQAQAAQAQAAQARAEQARQAQAAARVQAARAAAAKPQPQQDPRKQTDRAPPSQP